MDCEASVGGAALGAAASSRVIGIGVLPHAEVCPEVLVTVNITNEGDGDESFSSGGVGIESSEDSVGDSVASGSEGSVVVFIDDQSID